MNKHIFTGLFIAGTLMSFMATTGHAQSCSYTSQANDIDPDGLCAPVNADWEITYRGVDDGGTGNVSIYVDWGDGTTETISATEYEAGNWQINTSHIYPENGNQCNYEARAMLFVDGTECTSSIQSQSVTVWDTDDENGGIMSIAPTVYPICVGSDGTVQFTDASQWNCTPPYEEDTPNDRNRWTQWIYGTGGTTITDAEINGTTISWPDSGKVEYYTAAVTAPSPPNSQSETIYIPPGYNVGDYFEVTIRNWNTCNPYNENLSTPPGDPVNGDNPPVETTAIALIVDNPDATIDPAGPFCETDPPVALNAADDDGTWSGNGVDSATGVFTPLDAGPGTHTIQYDITDSNGCSASGTTVIEVREAPLVDITPGTSNYLCPGLDLQLTVDITSGTGPYSIQWTGDTSPLDATDIENPTFNTTNIGIFNLTIEVTDNNGCRREENITIEVEDVSINFDSSPVEVCAGILTELAPNVTGGSNNFVGHSWSGPEINKLSATDVPNPGFLSDETGSFTFTYTVTDDMGCSDQTNISLVAKEQPTANAGQDDLTCSLEYQLTGNSHTNGSGSWQVVSGPGNVSFNDPTLPDALATADKYGTYELVWNLAIDQCTDSDIVEITFARQPSPSTGNDFDVCGLSASLEAFPDIANGRWSMRSGPGNITFADDTDPSSVITSDAPGTYTFVWTEISHDGCSGEATQSIEFMPQAIAEISPFPDEGCTPRTINFNNISVNAESYRWDFGDGSSSSQENPRHIFEATGDTTETFTVTLSVSNSYNCSDEVAHEVMVNPIPNAGFDASEQDGCSPITVDFSNTTKGADSYTWNFDDGTPPSNAISPAHTFINTETYTQSYLVEMTAENNFGCTDNHSMYISAYPVRDIELAANPEEGCSPIMTEFSTEFGAMEYLWDFGDGHTEKGTYSASHVFENNSANDSTFHITVTGTSSFGCKEEATTTVLVHPSPQPAFEASPAEQQMPNRTVSVVNQTPGNWNYHWDFGDETTSNEENPQPHQYTESGNYEIRLKAFSEYCEASISNFVSISPMVPAIDYGESQSGCPPLTVSFYNNTLDATTYLWEFGDGRVSQDSDPTHTYRVPGTYNVKLTAYGPGGSITADDVTIEVFENPTVLFEPVPKVVFIPDEGVTFVNRTEAADSYYWLFGDGNTSTEFSPTHYYNNVGSYDVTLRAENNKGCTDERIIPNAVKAEQGGEIDFPNAFTPNKGGGLGGDYTRGERSNHVFYPSLQKGIVEYKLQIFSRWGELLFESNDVNKGWDGYYSGKLAPQGVYIWRVTATYSNGRRIEKAGDVTLLR